MPKNSASTAGIETIDPFAARRAFHFHAITASGASLQSWSISLTRQIEVAGNLATKKGALKVNFASRRFSQKHSTHIQKQDAGMRTTVNPSISALTSTSSNNLCQFMKILRLRMPLFQ